MKTIIRPFIYSLFALWTATLVFGKSFQVLGGLRSFLYTAAVFGLLNLLIKPVLKLIFFPINLLSFGLFSWVTNVILLYLLTRIVTFVKIADWKFPGFSYASVNLSAYNLNFWETFIVISLFIGIIVNLLLWLSK